VVRVRSSALLNPLKHAGFSKIQQATALSPGALDTTELLGRGFVHLLSGVPLRVSTAPLILTLVLAPLLIGAARGGMIGSQ
jgi:hypothetical protein